MVVLDKGTQMIKSAGVIDEEKKPKYWHKMKIKKSTARTDKSFESLFHLAANRETS